MTADLAGGSEDLVREAQVSIAVSLPKELQTISAFSPKSSQNCLLDFPSHSNVPGKPRLAPATQDPQLRGLTFNSIPFPSRKQKKLPPAKQTPEALAETGTKDDNSVNIIRETLLSEKPDLAQEEIELRD